MSELNCSICYERYSEVIPGMMPRILKACFHTICEGCAKKIQTGSKVVCPFDRQETYLTDGNVELLRRDFAILDALEEETLNKKIQTNGINNEAPKQGEKSIFVRFFNCIKIFFIWIFCGETRATEQENEFEALVRENVEAIQRRIDNLIMQQNAMDTNIEQIKINKGGSKSAGDNRETFANQTGLIGSKHLNTEKSLIISKAALGEHYCKFYFHCFEEGTKMRAMIEHTTWAGKVIWESENAICFLYDNRIIEFHMNRAPTNGKNFSDEAHINIYLTDNNASGRIASTKEFLSSDHFPNHTRSVLAIHKNCPVRENAEFKGIVHNKLAGKSKWTFQYYDYNSGHLCRSFLNDMIRFAKDEHKC